MKRSKNIRLVLISGAAAGVLTACGPTPLAVRPDHVYSNNYYLPGVGYYHAPFRAWYNMPYNHYDSATRRYFYGGQWGEVPFRSITNLSSPTVATASYAQAQRTDIRRGGFGRSSWHSSTYS